MAERGQLHAGQMRRKRLDTIPEVYNTEKNIKRLRSYLVVRAADNNYRNVPIFYPLLSAADPKESKIYLRLTRNPLGGQGMRDRRQKGTQLRYNAITIKRDEMKHYTLNISV